MSQTISGPIPYDLANLTAPADGVTQGVRFQVILTGGGSAQIPMAGFLDQIGDYRCQAMTVDASKSTSNLVITETVSGWTRTVPAGATPTFQIPAVQQQIFMVSSGGTAQAILWLYNWPAFVDDGTNNGSVGASVTVLGGNIAITSNAAPYAALPHNPAFFAITVGGTAVSALTAGTATAGGVVTNPTNATESLFVDIVNTAQVASSGGTNGTSFELLPGQSFQVPPITTAVSVNAATTGHSFSALGLV